MTKESSSTTHGETGLPSQLGKILESYRKLLLKEMVYQKARRWNEHRATNGHLVRKAGRSYVYRFDLDVELFLADDAPLTLRTEDESHRGFVLACEGSQITIVLTRKIGDDIPSAELCFDTWELLHPLANQMTSIGSDNAIAIKLMGEGPRLATKKPADNAAKDQDAALEHALQNPVSVVWAPPGSAKERYLSEVSICSLSQSKSVLIVSHSNASVDEAITCITDHMQANGMADLLADGAVLRFGRIQNEALAQDVRLSSANRALRKHEVSARKLKLLQSELANLNRRGLGKSERGVTVKEKIDSILSTINGEERACVDRAMIVGTTVGNLCANSVFEGRSYDVVIYDEASTALVPQVICAAACAREHLILTGGFWQLGPVVQSKDARALSRNIFWYLGICDMNHHAYYHPWLVLLDNQRQTHPHATALSSRAFYNALGRFDECSNRGHDITSASPFPGSAMNLVDLSGTYCTAGESENHSHFNILSAAISFACALTAEAGNQCTVSVVSPHMAQSKLISAMIEDCRPWRTQASFICSSGSQRSLPARDVIVLDAVDSHPLQGLVELDSVDEATATDRLVNSTITRARGKLITIANSKFWQFKAPKEGCAFSDLVEYHKEHGNIVSVANGSLAELLDTLDFGPNIMVFNDMNKAVDRLVNDISRADHRIIISIPDGKLEELYEDRILEALLNAKSQGAEVLLKCLAPHELPQHWKRLSKQSDNAIYPLVLIDDMILWHGMPPARGMVVDKSGKCYLTTLETPMRLTGKKTVRLVKMLTDAEGLVVNGLRTSLHPQAKSGGHRAGAFAQYVQGKARCARCGAQMTVMKSAPGHYSMICTACGRSTALADKLIWLYLCEMQRKCPVCGSDLSLYFGAKGPYIVCEKNHTIWVDSLLD